ncbi:S26 family signal peptidase [Actinomycetes bacterium KLBMP 9797]
MAGLVLTSVVGAILLAALLVARALLQVVGVHGDSMTPTYQHGDQLLVLRRGFRRRLRVGTVVVCLPPPGVVITDGDAAARSQLMVKRVAALPDGRVHVLGDAPRHSMDSRMFGPLAPELVRGVVLRRLRAATPREPDRAGSAAAPREPDRAGDAAAPREPDRAGSAAPPGEPDRAHGAGISPHPDRADDVEPGPRG